MPYERTLQAASVGSKTRSAGAIGRFEGKCRAHFGCALLFCENEGSVKKGEMGQDNTGRIGNYYLSGETLVSGKQGGCLCARL